MHMILNSVAFILDLIHASADNRIRCIFTAVASLEHVDSLEVDADMRLVVVDRMHRDTCRNSVVAVLAGSFDSCMHLQRRRKKINCV